MGLEKGDLKRLVHTELHIDEYASKMGDDRDICVLSFKVSDKEPALDLVNFIEKGYVWVLDADVSSCEMDDGEYIVFVEIERNQQVPKQIMDLMSDVMNLTLQDISDWRVRYRSVKKDHELSVESLAAIIPATPEKYESKYGKDQDKDEESSTEDQGTDDDNDQPIGDPTDQEIKETLDKLRAISGIKVATKAPKNGYTESLRIAAGIK